MYHYNKFSKLILNLEIQEPKTSNLLRVHGGIYRTSK